MGGTLQLRRLDIQVDSPIDQNLEAFAKPENIFGHSLTMWTLTGPFHPVKVNKQGPQKARRPTCWDILKSPGFCRKMGESTYYGLIENKPSSNLET